METAVSSSLTSAVSLLKELSESKQDLKPAVGECHSICLTHRDADGFLWSIKLLQGVINHLPAEDLEPGNLSPFLQECFQSAGEESPAALSAFHVAMRHSDEALFVNCLADATSDLLKYHAGLALGSILQQRETGRREALKWFQVSSSVGENLSPDYKAVASYRVTKTLVQLGDIDQATLTLEEETSIKGSAIASALLSLITAEIKRKEMKSREEVTSWYVEARQKLAKFLVNLEHKLADMLGGSCCTTLFFLNHIRYDRFTKYFMLTMPPRPEILATPLPICFAAYDLYREARCDITQLQQGWNDAQDARSHIEEGAETIYDVSFDVSVTAVDPLVLGQQIALKTKDLDSLHWAGAFLDDHLGRETARDNPDTFPRLIAAFEKYSRDGEDIEAWALYYTGRPKSGYVALTTEQHRFLEQSLERAKTPLLRYFAAFALATASKHKNVRNKYLEKCKNYVSETGNEELFIYTMRQLFDFYADDQMFVKAHEVQQEVAEASTRFINGEFATGVASFMEGYLKFSWGDIPGASVHFEQSLQLLEPLQQPDPAALVTYLCSNYKDHTLSYYGRESLQHTFQNVSVMVNIYK